MSDDKDQSSEVPTGSAAGGEESARPTSSSISGQNAVVSTSTNGSYKVQRSGPLDEDLVQASARGDLDKVIALLMKGATADAIVGERNTTPLYCAAKYGHLNVVEYLIDRGADTFTRRRHSGTIPLHTAAEAGHTAVVNALLKASPSSMCEEDADGMTPLHLAVKNNRVATVEYLLTESITPLRRQDRSGSTPLLTAVKYSWSKTTRTLLPYLNAPDLRITNIAGWNALDICIKDRRFKTATALLKMLTPDDLETSSAEGHSALTRAVFMDLEDFVRLLLGKNARVNVEVSDEIMSGIWRPQQDFQEKAEQLGLNFKQNFAPDSSVYRPDASVDPRAKGNRPESVLSVAATLANAKIVDLLLRNQNEVDFAVGGEGSALYFACERGYESIVESLLRCRPGPNVNHRVNQGAAPIHAASRWCHWNVVEILLDRGASADQPDQKCPFGWTGLTPLHYAILAENLKIVQKIMEPIVEAALQDALQKRIEIGGTRMNALHVAALSGGDCVLKYLLNRGADPSLRNSNGDTALHVAVSSGNATGVRALLDPHDSSRAYSPKDLLEVKNNSGETAWALAIISTFRNAAVVQTFLKYPESIDLTLSEIENSILWAAKHRDIHDLVRLQLSGRPSTFLEDLNTKLWAVLKRDSWTALHWASYHGHRYLVGRLIQSGGNQVESARISARKMVELILAHLNQAGDLKSDYDDTLHMLSYPDIQLNPESVETSNLDQLNQRPTHAGGSQKDLEGFHARIADFYVAEGDIPTFLPQSRSVHQVVYDHGPEQIMDRARTSRDMRFGPQHLKFRWIHLPANNIEWMKDCAKQMCIDFDIPKENFYRLMEFFDQSWQQLPSGEAERHFMKPVYMTLRPRPKNLLDREAFGLVPDSNTDIRHSATALYMPYLTLSDSNQGNDRYQKLFETCKDSTLHGSRTLDEFYYQNISDAEISRRNQTQVVTRRVHRSLQGAQKSWPIIRVDQLWIWMVDEKTIISSSTHRMDNAQDPVFENVWAALQQSKAAGKINRSQFPTYEMLGIITDACIGAFEEAKWPVGSGFESIHQLFENSINNMAKKEEETFRDFTSTIASTVDQLRRKRENMGKGKKSEDIQNDIEVIDRLIANFESINGASKLLEEIKDIRDELNILHTVLKQQKQVWDDLSSYDPQGIGFKGPDYIISSLEEMDVMSGRIQDAVKSILDLEQNEVSILEAISSREQAQESIQQGRTLMIFTIVTIIFLPMSWLTSLFALNVSSFPHSEGAVLYSPGYIFPIIFGVTTGISIPLMWIALNLESVKKFFPWNSKHLATSWKTSATASSGLPLGRTKGPKYRGLKSSPKLGEGKPKVTEGQADSIDPSGDKTQNVTKVAGEFDKKSEQRSRPGFWMRKRAGTREQPGLENAENCKLAVNADGTGSRRDLERGE